jgi:hypothetical protein
MLKKDRFRETATHFLRVDIYPNASSRTKNTKNVASASKQPFLGATPQAMHRRDFFLQLPDSQGSSLRSSRFGRKFWPAMNRRAIHCSPESRTPCPWCGIIKSHCCRNIYNEILCVTSPAMLVKLKNHFHDRAETNYVSHKSVDWANSISRRAPIEASSLGHL